MNCVQYRESMCRTLQKKTIKKRRHVLIYSARDFLLFTAMQNGVLQA